MKGLFIGLTTLDFIYLSPDLPQPNQKIVALEQAITAGGPATNSAITFSYLGNQAHLLSVLGKNALTATILQDLATYHVQHQDLEPTGLDLPPVSSIIVTQKTGERAVISINAQKSQIAATQGSEGILEEVDILLIDGHQLEVSQVLGKAAKGAQIPVVLDGGSWKPGLEKILPWVDHAICSANFQPPGCENSEQVFSYLHDYNIAHRVITQGEGPILYQTPHERGQVAIETIQAVDTLGAGDIFHGAFCHFILQQDFLGALKAAAQIATYSCQFFGPRGWMGDGEVGSGKWEVGSGGL